MTESAAPTIPYVPPGHPVRRFVVGIACIAALLGAVWWSGIGRPRLSVHVTEVSPQDATIVLTNDGPTSVELRAAEFDHPRLDGESIDLPAGALSGGASIELSLRFRTACESAPDVPFYIPLRVTARTALGLDRTLTAGDVSTLGELACDTGTDVPIASG